MSSFLYKVREFLQNLIPVAIVGALAFGGYTLYKQGTFRNGFRPAMNSIVRKVPFFGSKFGHYLSSGSSYKKSYVTSNVNRRSRVSKRHNKSRKHKMIAKRGRHKSRRHHR